MSEASLTPQTAPRTKEALLSEKPFQLRLLVQQLGGLADEQSKMSWHNASADARTDYAVQLLKEWDKANPGQAVPQALAAVATPAMTGTAAGVLPAPAANGFRAPPASVSSQGALAGIQAPLFPTPGTSVHMVAQVPPASAQQAQEALSAPRPSRRPRTNADAAAPAGLDVGADILALLQRLGAAVEQQTSAYKNVQGLLEEAVSSKTSRVTSLEAKYADLDAQLKQLSSYLLGISNVQIWTLTAVLTSMQETMGVPLQTLLKAAIDDSASFQKLVDSATGKA